MRARPIMVAMEMEGSEDTKSDLGAITELGSALDMVGPGGGRRVKCQDDS